MKFQLVLGLVAMLQLHGCRGQLCFSSTDRVITIIAKTGLPDNSHSAQNNIAPMFPCTGGQLVDSAGTALKALGKIVECAVEGALYTLNAIDGLALQVTSTTGDIMNALGFDGSKYQCVNGQLIDTLGTVVRAAGNIAGCLVEGAYYLVGDIGAGIVEGAGTVAGDIIQQVGNVLGIGDVAHGVSEAVVGASDIAGGLIEGIADFKGVVEGGAIETVGAVGGDVIDTAVNVIGDTLGGAGQALTDLSHGDVIAATGDVLGTVIQGTGDVLQGTVDVVGDTLQGVANVAEGVADVAVNTVEQVVKGTGEAVQGTVDAVQHAVQDTGKFISNIFGGWGR